MFVNTFVSILVLVDAPLEYKMTRIIKNVKVNVKVNPQATSAEITASAANQFPSSSINGAGDSPDPHGAACGWGNSPGFILLHIIAIFR